MGGMPGRRRPLTYFYIVGWGKKWGKKVLLLAGFVSV